MSANTMKATGLRGLLLTLVLLAAAGAAHGANNAQFISQSVPAAMVPGQSYAVSVTMKNTGTTTWTRAGNYKLGSINPFNNTTWGMNRVLLPTAADPVAPGQSVTFSFNVTAPTAPGTYNFRWQTVLDGIEFFGDLAPNVAVKVGLNDAAFVSQSVPTVMTPGQSYAVSVTMQNTGGTTWTSATNYKLGSINPFNNTTWGPNRVLLPNANPVAPGQSVTFSFNVTAPATPGTYNFQWQTVLDGIEFFGALAPNVAVKVGLDNAAFVSQSVPATMAPGNVYPVSVTMQNTGSTTWSPGSVSLGSQNPVDNTAWGPSRVALPSSVAPGASVTFSFNVTAPSAVGPYNFQWRVLEGASSWFGATTTNVAVTVAGAPLAGMHFIHVDHLNTPRLVADATGTTVWRWEQQEPFGVNVPDEDPDGNSVGFEFPLRFPGQYADKETNLYYNYFRDYDSVTGRYFESDPIGLQGGLNTFAYATSSPLAFTDEFGLESDPYSGLGLSTPATFFTMTTFAAAQRGVTLNQATQSGLLFRGFTAPVIAAPAIAASTPYIVVGGTTVPAAACAVKSVLYSRTGQLVLAAALQLNAANSPLVRRIAPGLAGPVPSSMASQIAQRIQAGTQTAQSGLSKSPRAGPPR